MSEKEQIEQFSNELDKLVERFRKEYELTYGSVVGSLHMKAYLLCKEAQEREDELDD